MPFETMFTVASVVVGAGFVTGLGLVIYRAVRSARDAEYRARLELQAQLLNSRDRSSSSLTDPGNPASPMNPSSPASPMFPGNPGNPL